MPQPEYPDGWNISNGLDSDNRQRETYPEGLRAFGRYLTSRRETPMKTILAVAATALICSTTATAVTSALITTEQIKNGTIRMVDLHPSARAGLKGQRGLRGPDGAPGPVGAQGPAGVAGPRGTLDPAKMQVVTSESATVSPGVPQTVTVTCPAGTFVVSGGGFTSGPGLWLARPSGNGWVVGANPYSSISATVQANAICATP